METNEQAAPHNGGATKAPEPPQPTRRQSVWPLVVMFGALALLGNFIIPLPGDIETPQEAFGIVGTGWSLFMPMLIDPAKGDRGE